MFLRHWRRQGTRTQRVPHKRSCPQPACRLSLESLEDRLLMSGDAILHWNKVAVEAAFAPGPPSPVPFFRNLAVVYVSMFDAVNAIDRSYAPYFADVQASGDASMEAAAAQASHDTLSALYPDQKATFDAALAEDLVGIPPDGAQQGIEVGQEVANQILAWRSTDGSGTPATYSLPPEPSNWQTTGGAAAFVHAASITPFAVDSSSQFRPSPPPSLTSVEYATDFNEAKALGQAESTSRTMAQTNAAMAWRTPPSIEKAWFVDIAGEVAEARGNSLPENARLFALLGVANNDTLQTTFESKYHYGLWRPVTAIQRADEDGNADTVPDPTWTPLHPATPPYPTYAGNAAGVAATFATVLNRFFGSDNVSFDIQWPASVGGTRSYASFGEAAQETADSRIWGGIHFRFDSVAGQQVGTNVGDHVFENFFQPAEHGRVLGDANLDGQFDQFDIIAVQSAAKYNTGEPTTFSEGDWNDDGVFNQLDIVAALQTGAYLTTTAAAVSEEGFDGSLVKSLPVREPEHVDEALADSW